MTAIGQPIQTHTKSASGLRGLIDDLAKLSYLSDLGASGGSSAVEAPNIVTATDSIEVGEVDGSQWVRVNGKGNFMSSPQLKEFVDTALDGGCQGIVVDLENCPAMDSTFMGTLAGLAMRLQPDEGRLMVVGLSERNRESLEDLGLDALLELEEEGGSKEWNGRMDSIRGTLKAWDGQRSSAAAAEEVLEAHRKLCEADSNNNSKFGAVLQVLEQECASKASQ